MFRFPLSSLPAALGAKALAGIAVASVAGVGGTAAVLNSLPASSHSATTAVQGPANAGNAQPQGLEGREATGAVASCAASPSPHAGIGACVSRAVSSPDPSDHASPDATPGMRSTVVACQKARDARIAAGATGSAHGIGDCVSDVASGGKSDESPEASPDTDEASPDTDDHTPPSGPAAHGSASSDGKAGTHGAH